ncbi:MAG: glycosyltransferase, partial [Bacteroidia bacterium]|nr:glycosyltransferase [Bacteroidia bacterium]
MNILILGDNSGNDDEGMKKIARKIALQLNRNDDCNVQFASLKEVLFNLGSYKNIDLIHSLAGPTYKTFLYIYLIKRVLKQKPKTIISMVHPHWNILSHMLFQVFRPDAVMIFSSKWDFFYKQYDIQKTSFSVMGFDPTKFFKVNNIEKQLLRKKLNLPLDKKIILHVGHMNKGRNLQVFNSLKDDTSLYPLIIGSTTVSHDKDLVNELQNCNINIIDTYLPSIDEYYKAADCYIFPTINPRSCIQVPLSIIEALACGLPVISTKFEGLPYYFYQGYNIKYVNSFDNIIDEVYSILSNDNIYNDGIDEF